MKKYRNQKAGKHILETYDALLAAWGVAYEELDLEGEYGSTHVIAAGDKEKPPVVLFHGVGDDSALMWVYNAKALAKEYRLYAVDTIGGPGKSIPGQGYNAQFDDVKWLDQVFDGLKLKTASVVGVSHGGYLAQLYALKRPERVETAIAIASSVPLSKNGSPMKTMMTIFLPEALFPTEKNTVKLLKKLSGTHWKAFTDNPLILNHYRWLLKGFNNMAMVPHKVGGFSLSEIAGIRDKVFYLAGEMDPFQMLGGKQDLLNCQMNVRFYEDAGHGLNHELADEINGIIGDILASKRMVSQQG